MSLFTDTFTVPLPAEEAFSRTEKALLPLGAKKRNNGFVLPNSSHVGVTYPLTVLIVIEADTEGTRFQMSGSNMGLGMMQKKIGITRFAEIRAVIEKACRQADGEAT